MSDSPTFATWFAMRQRTRPSWLLAGGFLTPVVVAAVLLLTPAAGLTAEPPEEKPSETVFAAEFNAAANPFPDRTQAPSLDGGKGWLNTSGDLSLKELRGKVVLIDFWTFCCINCMHVLPDLKYLEQKYSKEVVVIGVHSAKFENEKETENIRRAIQRYEIEHPVVNDADMTIWQKFDVHSWPTIVIIDPEGYYCGFVPGEGRRAVLEQVIDRLVTYHKAKGTLDLSPVHFDLERKKLPPTPLRFPGKVLADAAGDRLFVSDSNHNRIVVSTLEGKLLEVIGTGAIGRKNGGYDEATFDHPQGMALVGERLYVADTENHLIREIDLAKKRVTTVAGTGKQAKFHGRGGKATITDLNSPWDLVFVRDKLYIAMAGPHQIWALDLKAGKAGPYAGSGQEDVLNGSLSQSALAQPSGIATDGNFLYVVDSEGSSVRKVPLDPAEQVTTIVGTSDLPSGRSLFAFGDRDGVGGEARLQHPLGIALYQGNLFVADSYNHKIKRVDLAKSQATTYLGDAKPGDRLSPPRFSEPAGLSVAGEKLFVADTNNHRLLRVDLKTEKAEIFTIAGLTPPPPRSEETIERAPGKIVAVPKQTVAGTRLTFEIALKVPAGYKLNKEFPTSYRLSATGKQSLVPATALNRRQKITLPESGESATFEIPLTGSPGAGQFQLSLSYGYCRDGANGICKLHTATWSLPIEVTEPAAKGETPIRLVTPTQPGDVKSPS